jgi:hypothetical protein
MTEQFTCAVCQGTFDKGWSDDEARQECTEIFGEWKDEDCVVVCDDCFVKPMSYEELKAKARKDMADYYRAERKHNPAIARMIWKIQAEMQKQLTDAIMYGIGVSQTDAEGNVKHIGLAGLLNDRT